MKENIIEKLKDCKSSISLIEINDLLGLTSVEDYQELQKIINILISEGKVHRTKKDKYILTEKCSSIITGYIRINKNGNGFVTGDNGEDIFIEKSNLNSAIDGDYVEVDYINNEGIVINILKRDLNFLVGEIINKHGKLGFILDDKKKNISLEITKEPLNGCVEGHKVLVKIIKELKANYYLGKIVKIIGHKNDPGVDILAIAYSHEISPDFSDASLKQLESIPTSIKSEEIKDRKDLRKETIFTIDGDDTKDIDDAISIKKENENYILGVHIADVSYYVKEGTPLFEDAFSKGTSSYLADTVLPMLPHRLSNGICSLNENEDRLTISCIMTINSKGQIINHDIFRSVIRSKKQMTYNNVNKILIEGIVPDGYENYKDDLFLMKELSDILRKAKINRGYIDFSIDEAKVIQDENGKAIDIVKRLQLAGENLIEDFMIAANETIASNIYNMDLPFVYRVHGEPKTEKIEEFLNFLKIMNYKLDVNTNNITPKTMQKILLSLKDSKAFDVFSDMLLRSMKKAVYSPDNIGHFGLASNIYTHFTSPIRRFPDLMVHTLLNKYLFECNINNETIKYYQNILEEYTHHASIKEQASDEAERDVLDMKMAEYMEDHINEEYNGIISGVANFGFFVKLDNLVEGLVHVSTLNGFYTYVPELLSLVSNNNIKYTIGDKVKVKVVNASKEKRIIDFELVGEHKKYGNKK